MTQSLALNAEALAEQSTVAGVQPLLRNLVECQRIELLCLCLLNANEGPGDAEALVGRVDVAADGRPGPGLGSVAPCPAP